MVNYLLRFHVGMSTFYLQKKEKEKKKHILKRKAEGGHVAIDEWEEGDGQPHPLCEVGYKGFGSDRRLCVGVSDVSFYWCAQEALHICNGGQRCLILPLERTQVRHFFFYAICLFSWVYYVCILLNCVDIVRSVVSVVGFKVLWAEYSMGPGVLSIVK